MLKLRIRFVRTSVVGGNDLGGPIHNLQSLLNIIFGDTPQFKVKGKRLVAVPPLSPEGQEKVDLFGVGSPEAYAFNAHYLIDQEAAIAQDEEIQALLKGA